MGKQMTIYVGQCQPQLLGAGLGGRHTRIPMPLCRVMKDMKKQARQAFPMFGEGLTRI